jgi:hypothetical protein
MLLVGAQTPTRFRYCPLPPGESGGSQAFGINSSGAIVGKVRDRAVLWPPNAEPVFLPTGGAATA